MPLALEFARRDDAARIAEIHMAAFGPNAMLQAQFPMPLLHEWLQRTIETKAMADIDDSKTTVLVVRDVPGDEANGDMALEDHGIDNPSRRAHTIAFAKWSHPVADDENYSEPPWVWPEGTNWEVLEGWAKKSEEAQERALGRTPCYRLTFMGTDPAYRGRGAASLLLQWGIKQCEAHKAPAYLESTLDAAKFYKKRGFTPVETFSLDISHVGGGIYSETSFTYVPAKGQ